MPKKERKRHSEFTYEHHEGRTGRVVTASVMSHGKRYVGAAKCSPEDEYSQSTGEMIAMLRASRKMYQADAKFYAAEVKRATFILEDLKDMVKHWEKTLKRSTKALEDCKVSCGDVKDRLNDVLNSTK